MAAFSAGVACGFVKRSKPASLLMRLYRSLLQPAMTFDDCAVLRVCLLGFCGRLLSNVVLEKSRIRL